jgi:hypothetical protein
MSAEKLRALVGQGNLINLNITSDSLTTLLSEVATMLVDQQQQLVVMRQQISEKLSCQDFTEFKDQWRSDRDLMMRSIPDFDSVIEKITSDVDFKTLGMRSMLDESVTSMLMSVDNRIAQKMDTIAGDQMVVRQNIASVEQQMKALSGTLAVLSATPSGALGAMSSGIAWAMTPPQTPDRVTRVPEPLPAPAPMPAPVPAPVPPPVPAPPPESPKSEPVDAVSPEPEEPVQSPPETPASPEPLDVSASPIPRRSARIYTMSVPVARVSEPPPSENDAPEAAAPAVDVVPARDDPEFLNRIARLERDLSAFVNEGSDGLREIIGHVVSDQLQSLMVSQPPPMSEVEREFEALHQHATPTAPHPPPEELEEIRQAVRRIELTLDDQGKDLLGRVQRKAEITLVERMFEKLRGIVALVKDEINALGFHVEKLVRRSEMEEFVETSLASLIDEEQAAAANKPLKCLACGRPRLRTSAADTFVARPGPLPPLSPEKAVKQ